MQYGIIIALGLFRMIRGIESNAMLICLLGKLYFNESTSIEVERVEIYEASMPGNILKGIQGKGV